MGYYIRALPQKKKPPHWKVQFVTYKRKSILNPKAKKPKKEWDIPPERWPGLKFRSTMNLAQAKLRQQQLNSQLELRRQEERRKSIEVEQQTFDKKCSAYLPEIYKKEFENRYIFARSQERLKKSKHLSHW